MPNWCKGNIRLRGRRNAIVEFLKNELESTGYDRLEDGPVTGTLEINDEYDEVSVKIPEDKRDLLFAAFYIKGTRRNFIDGKDISVYMDNEDADEVHTICIDDFRAAWHIDPEPYVTKSERYGIDIRILGFERGMQFIQDIEIIKGKLVNETYTTYDELVDWVWKCPMPHMGG